MTRKDYTLIAKAFKEQKKFMVHFPGFYDAEQKWAIESEMTGLASKLAEYLKRGNPRFDSTRFLEACGCDKAVSMSE
jgi:hypothetical protein